MSKSAKQFLRKRTKHNKWDGIIHFGNNGMEQVDVVELLDIYSEQECKSFALWLESEGFSGENINWYWNKYNKQFNQ
jgi:hypothetical protein